MRILWTLIKVALVLAIGIPLAIIALGISLGILGTLFGLAIMTLKFACIALVGWGAFKLIAHVVGGSGKPAPVKAMQLPPVDPYYEAARRELDRELGETR